MRLTDKEKDKLIQLYLKKKKNENSVSNNRANSRKKLGVRDGMDKGKMGS